MRAASAATAEYPGERREQPRQPSPRRPTPADGDAGPTPTANGGPAAAPAPAATSLSPPASPAPATSPAPAAAPATAAAPAPAVPLGRAAACFATSALLWTTQGLGMNLVAGNLPQLQGDLGVTANEAAWLVAAYMAPNVSLTILLTKIRTQIGLRRFAEISIAVFVFAALLHLVVRDLNSVVATRFLAGAAASPVSTLAFLYMLDAFPPAKKLNWGLSLALMFTTAMPIVARLVSPALLDIGQWSELYTFEVGLALAALAAVYLLPLTPVPHAKVLHWLDFVSYPLIAAGFGLFAVVMTLGRLYWWFEAPALGVCLALSVLAIGLAAAVEVNRETPLVDLDWLRGPEVVRLTLTLLIFRIVLSEQSTGAFGLFQQLGLFNEQSRILYLVILAATVAGSLVSGAVLKLERVPAITIVALAAIAAGAFMDAHATSQTRPGDMLASQALIAFGGGLFLPGALLAGLLQALKRGPMTITSFLVVFLFTQSVGGLIGQAAFGTFVTLREKFHSNVLVEHIALTDPIVAERVRQLGAAYGRVLTDGRLINAEGLATLSTQATREAYILAYNDAFLVIAAIASVACAAFVAAALYRRLRSSMATVGTNPAPAPAR